MLGGLTDASLDDFPFGTAQELEVGGVPVFALRASYVGELGWELNAAAGDAEALYDAVVAAGAAHGMQHAGYHAMNALRLEAGYKHWGHDISDEDTPLESGLGFAVAWDKAGGFIGRETLLAQREQPRTKRLLHFRLEDTERLLYHDEPIWADGELVGRTSSAMWSYVEGRPLAMGYVLRDDGVTKEWVESATWQIEVAGERLPATASVRPFYAARTRM